MTARRREPLTEFNTLSQAAAARYLGVSRQRVGALVRERKLRAYDVPGVRSPRLRLKDLEARRALFKQR